MIICIHVPNLDKFGLVMKNLGKGLLVVFFGLGVVFTPGLTLFLAEGPIPKDFEEEEQRKEDPPNKDKKKTILAICDIDSDKLNLNSNGKWITAYIELPRGYDVHDIVLEGILLNDFLSPEIKPFNIGDRDNNNIPDLMIKFDRSAVISNLEPLQFSEMTITGILFDGIKFEATCVIELLHY